jgi:hypothetical protein
MHVRTVSNVPYWRSSLGGYTRVAASLGAVVMLVGCGTGSLPADSVLPPEGEMWFGNAFDPVTFEIDERITSVGATEAFVVVARLPRSVSAAEMSVRVYLDGDLLVTEAANAEGEGEIWGWPLGPLYSPGVWRYEIIDVGGNALAAGEIRATP